MYASAKKAPMTSPPENITVRCPECGRLYEDWHRPSINLDIDPELGDPEYLHRAMHAQCPECGHEVALGGLVVRGDIRELR